MWPFKRKEPDSPQEPYSSVFVPRVIKELDDFVVITAVCEVAVNDEGRMGVVLATGYQCHAVQEINKDLTFSKKGHYWTKKPWKRFNPPRFALCNWAVSRTYDGWKAKGSQVTKLGAEILEMDTHWRPPQDS